MIRVATLLLIPIVSFFYADLAYAQNGLVKTIKDFDGDLGQTTFLDDKLLFVEINDFSIANEDLWSYDLMSKELHLINSSIEHYSNGFFTFENQVLFNTKSNLVLYDVSTFQYDTIYKSNDIGPLSTYLEEAVYINKKVFFICEGNLWIFDTVSRKIEITIARGRIIGSGTNNIYLRFNNSINAYNISSRELINIIPGTDLLNIIGYTVKGENLILLYYRGSRFLTALIKYDAATQESTKFDIAIGNTNADELYLLHDVNEHQLIFNDRALGKFWLYDNGLDELKEIPLVDTEGYSIAFYQQFFSDSSHVYVGGTHREGPNVGKSALFAYDIKLEQFERVITIESNDFDIGETGQVFSDSLLLVTSGKWRSDEGFLLSINTKTGTIDTIANELPFRQMLFQNSLIYALPDGYRKPYKIYRYDLEDKSTHLVEGSYYPVDDSYRYPTKFIQYQDETAFIWDVRNTLMTIDDSYVDSVLTTSSCDYYLLLGDSITQSGFYRKKIMGESIDTVVNLTINIDRVKSGFDSYYTFFNGTNGEPTFTLEAYEQNADTYHWFRCADSLEIATETVPVFYPDSVGTYSLVVNKGTCIDTTRCPIVVGLFDEEIPPTANIYPNPTNQGYVNFNSNLRTVFLDVKVFSVYGELKDYYRVKNVGTIKLDLPQGPGVYLLSISDGNQEIIEKIIKN